MNVYTIIGAALLNEEIRELLFDDPLKAAKRLGIVLIEAEVQVLRQITAGGKPLEDLIGKVANIIVCPVRPCAYELALQHQPVESDSRGLKKASGL